MTYPGRMPSTRAREDLEPSKRALEEERPTLARNHSWHSNNQRSRQLQDRAEKASSRGKPTIPDPSHELSSLDLGLPMRTREDDDDFSEQEIHDRWVARMNSRLDLDRVATNKRRFGKKALRPSVSSFKPSQAWKSL